MVQTYSLFSEHNYQTTQFAIMKKYNFVLIKNIYIISFIRSTRQTHHDQYTGCGDYIYAKHKQIKLKGTVYVIDKVDMWIL